jgi:hypothetical protein
MGAHSQPKKETITDFSKQISDIRKQIADCRQQNAESGKRIFFV